MYIYNIIFTFVLSTVIFKNFVIPKMCKRNEDCSKQIEGYACSFCVGEIKSAKCIYPLPELYIINSQTLSCNYNMYNVCKAKQPCKNNGKCYDNRNEEMYTCECKQYYVGKNCEINYNEIEYFFVYDIDIIISNKMCTTTPIDVQIIISKGDFINEINVESEDGYYVSMKHEKGDDKESNKWRMQHGFKATIRYPYKPYNANDKDFLYLGNNVLGYFTKVQLDIVHRGTNIFNQGFRVFVSYPEVNHCVPFIVLKGCGPDYKKPTAYYRWSVIRIISKLSVIPNGNSRNPFKKSDRLCGSPDEFNLTWKVRWMRTQVSTPNTVEVELFKAEPVLILEPWKDDLECGLYRVELYAENFLSEGISTNFKTCYFEIETLPLEAIIEGGTQRSVAKKDGVYLSAVNSKNPNVNPEYESLITQWSCVALKANGRYTRDICKPVTLRKDKPYFIPSNKLTEGEYNFTLEIWTNSHEGRVCRQCQNVKKHQFAYQMVFITNKTNPIILCQINCGQKVSVNNELILKASYHDNNVKFSYEWSYMKVGSSVNLSISSSNNYPYYLFRIPENTLDSASHYNVFLFVTVDGEYLSATYGFLTDHFVYQENCTIEPESGIRGLTVFDIECSPVADRALSFEFFDKTSKEASEGNYLVGRMLGMSNTGELQDFLLTRGVLVVYIKSGFNLANKTYEINLIDDNVKFDSIFKKMLHNPNFFQTMQYPLVMQCISALPDMITDNFTQKLFFDVSMQNLRTGKIKLVEDVKLYSVLMHNLLLKLGKGNMNIKALDKTRYTALRMTKILKQSVLDPLTPTNENEIKETIGMVLNILESSHTVANETAVDCTKKHTSASRYFHLLYLSSLLEQSFNDIQTILSALQKPGLPPTKISSYNNSFTFKVIQDDRNYNFSISQMLQINKDIPVSFSSQLAHRLLGRPKEEDNLSLNVGIVKKNLFKWFDKQPISSLLFISLHKHTLAKNVITNVRKISAPVTMEVYQNKSFVDVKEHVSHTIPLNLTSDEESLDLQIRVHRFDPAPGSKLSFTFLYPPTNDTLRVLMMEDYRPSFRMMMTDSTVISQQSPYYSPRHARTKRHAFYYMGVLPGPEIPLSHSVSYSFKVDSVSCVSWERVKWSSSGCRVGLETSDDKINCECNHLSIFGAIFPFMPTLVDPFADAKLFLTVVDNPLVVSLMIVLLAFYILLSMLSYHLDKKDRFRGTITVLEDNFPGDRHPYVLAVYTSSRFLAGTSAFVGVQIIGELANSRTHILKSRLYKVFRRQTDDWFLILCPKPLGLIKYLHLWHDNSGSHPGWYCTKVHIYDINNSLECLFLVDQWIELNVNKFPEALIVPASSADILQIEKVIGDNISKCIRERGSVTGIFTHHPRSTVRRIQIVNIFMCSLLAAMLISIMFYTDRRKQTPDYYKYNVKQKDVYVGLLMCGVVIAVKYVISFLFHKSYKCEPQKNRNSLYLRKNKRLDDYFDRKKQSEILIQVEPKPEEQKQTSKPTGFGKNLAKSVKRRIKTQDLAPAVLSHEHSVIKVKRFWLVLTWTTCAIIIILCSYLIMLYGLKMGLVKSKKWVTSLTISYVYDKIVVNPVTIVLLAVSITVSLGYVTGSSSYRATPDEIQLSTTVLDCSFDEIIVRRRQPMYYPISSKKREKAMKEKLKFVNRVKVSQLFLSLLYVISVVLTVHRIRQQHFERNNHLKELFNSANWGDKGVEFNDIYGIDDLEDYFENTLLKVIYHIKWYNRMSLQHTNISLFYWTADNSWRLIGAPYLRQQRVVEEFCNSIAPPLDTCIPPLNFGTEDTSAYGVAWTLYSPYDAWTSSSGRPWNYTYPTADWMKTFYRLVGRSGKVYDNSGYKANLGHSIQDTVQRVAQLDDNMWVDVLTKVAIVEMTLYNVNSHCLGQITLIVEFLTTGVSLKVARVNTLVVECGSLKLRQIVFIILTFFFFLHICYTINNYGFIQFFKKFTNIMLFFLVIPGIFIILAFLINMYLCRTLDMYDRYYDEKFGVFDFDTLVSFHTYSVFLLSLFLLIGVLRILLLLGSLDILTRIHSLLKLSLNQLLYIWLLTYISFFFILQLLINLDITTSHELMDLVVSQKKPKSLGYEIHDLTHIIFSFMKFFIQILISGCFITTYIHFNPIAKRKRRKKKNIENRKLL